MKMTAMTTIASCEKEFHSVERYFSSTAVVGIISALLREDILVDDNLGLAYLLGTKL